MEPAAFLSMAITVDGSARADVNFWAIEQRRLPVAPFSDNSYGYLDPGAPSVPIEGRVQGSIAGTVPGTPFARAHRLAYAGENGELVPTSFEQLAT